MDLQEATERLDPENNDHWTADGLPRMDAIAELTGDSSISRKDVTHVAPNLTRDFAKAKAYEAEHSGVVRANELDESVHKPPTLSDPINVDDLKIESTDPLPTGDVLELPIGTVLKSSKLTSDALKAINRKVNSVLREKTAVELELRQLYAKSDLLSRQQIVHDRIARKNGTKTTNVQDYLAAQAKTREERAARARKFIEAGTTPQEVVAQMRMGSRLDAAMKQRKPERGALRPPARGLTG